MANRVILILSLLVAVTVLVRGQEIYPDYLETSIDDTFGAPEDDLLQNVEPASAFWSNAPTSTKLSPSFIDKTLEGNCTGTSAIACTGCRRVRVCIPGVMDPALLPEVNCPPSTYCHTLAFDMGGACLATIDPQFPECRGTADIGGTGGGSVSNICTGLGVFPHPLDCRRFHLCTAVGSSARIFKCPANYVYNSQKKSCSRNTRCRKIQCHPNGRSVFIGYPQDPTYYAYCNYDRTGTPHVLRNILMYKCGAGSEFNELANGCVFKCPREGFFAKPGNSSRFYWCRKVRGNLFGYEQACPWPGSVFSAKHGICLPPTTTTTPIPTTATPATGAPTVPTAPTVDPATDTTSTTTTPLPPSTSPLADSLFQLPPWPQWPSLPVSSLL